MLPLEEKVHGCTTCKTVFRDMVPYPPIYSFGEPRNKPIAVVGLNPSSREFPDYFSYTRNAEERRREQLTYFDRPLYNYFEVLARFFGGGDETYQNPHLKSKLGWVRSPYERVTALDLVKCATVSRKGQWTSLARSDRKVIIRNCEGFLVGQLSEYRPKVVVLYGADVIDWFEGKLGKSIGDFEAFSASLGDYAFRGVAVPQRQGPHSLPEVRWVQDRLLELL